MKPVIKDSTVNAVTHSILRAILSGSLQPGERLSMSKLSAELQVSHIPVREALRRLETQGFITLTPGQGAMISPVTIDDAQEIYELRLLIEVAAAGRAAERYDESDISRIEKLAECMEESRTDDIDDYLAAHDEFQWAVLGPGTGPWSERLIRLLQRASERYYRMLMVDPARFASAPARRHHELVDAARMRDGARLQRLIAEHIQDTIAEMAEIMSDMNLNAAASERFGGEVDSPASSGTQPLPDHRE